MPVCDSSTCACREKQELDRLPAEIDTLTAAKAACEEQLAALSQQGSHGYQQAAELGVKLAKLASDIDAKTERWLELEDLADQS